MLNFVKTMDNLSEQLGMVRPLTQNSVATTYCFNKQRNANWVDLQLELVALNSSYRNGRKNKLLHIRIPQYSKP